MPDIKWLTPNEWVLLRDVRLTALQDSPSAFLSTCEEERTYSDDRWQREFIRGEWSVGFAGGEPVSLLGATREPRTPSDERYLEYLWVARRYRRSGIATAMLGMTIGHLRETGVRTVFLWVLDGNDDARNLYRSAGFVSTNHRQPLPKEPARNEERMRLDLI